MEKKTRREKNTEHQRAYRQRHPERTAASNRAYYARNREALAQKRREYRETVKSASAGAALRAHRKGLGLSQQKYAQALGVTAATVSNWERGIVPVNADTVEAAFPGMGKKMKGEK